ncbi:pyruvate kinase [Miltoncostaea marina]|uniref:pyruvate kinase n=1 Tax=Miltoncostaea marina TaxID=2843215 RepID=UPI001C3C40F8|nr:pyruvate kinase [Miltoncostaea marina]
MPDPGELDPAAVEASVRELREVILAAEAARAGEIAATHPEHRRSAANLVHYVALRARDIRDLQGRLAAMGLSSLGRSEGSVLGAIDAVLGALAGLTGSAPPPAVEAVGLEEGRELLGRNADALLGPAPAGRSTRIMVTLPAEAADDAGLVAGMAAAGMDLARVNCAHDAAGAWERMAAHVRAAPPAGGAPCRVAMDLAGPKLRTGPLEPGPRVVRARARKDDLGRTVRPARIALLAPGVAAPPAAWTDDAVALPVDDAGWVARRRAGDRIRVRDARGRRRRWTVEATGDGACLATSGRTSYVTTGMALTAVPGAPGAGPDTALVGGLPEVERAHRVARGDALVLTRSLAPAPATAAGEPHRIGCTLPEAFGAVRSGERVWLDDGKLGGVVERADADEIELTVTDAPPGGARLRAGKGINLPDTRLRLGAVTDKDLDDLRTVARHADVVDVSFVRRPEDVARLQAELAALGASDLGVVLKIENAAAFEALPRLLLQAMRSRRVGVMIARGDLAVEVGFERLAEVQEEIMWLCEAAHLPVIWATQVLDRLAKTGQPSRAEVTDAAMAQRAECVMLNKGPHIEDAIGALDSILRRMGGHHDKKRSLLRRLRAWGDPADAGGDAR